MDNTIILLITIQFNETNKQAKEKQLISRAISKTIGTRSAPRTSRYLAAADISVCVLYYRKLSPIQAVAVIVSTAAVAIPVAPSPTLPHILMTWLTTTK